MAQGRTPQTSQSRRTIAIGDIHGCAQELEALLEQLQLEKGDLIVFLGDYIDRGLESRRVIEIIVELSKHYEVVALKGNHEAMFLDFLDRPNSDGAGLFVLNGGSSTLANYAAEDGSFAIPEEHLRFLHSLKTFHQTEDLFFVHAGVPEIPLREITVEKHEFAMLWSRQPFLSTSFKWEKLVVHGHTPKLEPEIKTNRINVDTGCVYDGHLTAIEFPSRKLYRVKKGTKSKQALLFPLSREPGGVGRAMRFEGRLPVEAGYPNEQRKQFVTLNYNQLGLFIADLIPDLDPQFEIDDLIEGTIGREAEKAILFSGTVVRVDTRGPVNHYAIQMDSITNGNDGREWIQIRRPQSK